MACSCGRCSPSAPFRTRRSQRRSFRSFSAQRRDEGSVVTREVASSLYDNPVPAAGVRSSTYDNVDAAQQRTTGRRAVASFQLYDNVATRPPSQYDNLQVEEAVRSIEIRLYDNVFAEETAV
eukprot:Opistho-1_new@102335